MKTVTLVGWSIVATALAGNVYGQAARIREGAPGAARTDPHANRGA